jgi:predicted aspartyl protease
MSTFTEKITLTNTRDMGYANDGFIPQSKVRSLVVDAYVDTGAWFLVLNEETRAALGLKITGSKRAQLADGSVKEYGVTEPVEFAWKNRSNAMPALLIPEASTVLLGALCMEALDVLADPVAERLVGRHGEEALYQVF